MLGVFAKIPDREPAKTRLQARFTAAQTARFQLAAIADVVETAARIVETPWLFLAHGDDRRERIGALLLEHGLDPNVWTRVRLEAQRGAGLGERMAHALSAMCARGTPALLLGSDSPSLDAPMLERAFTALASRDVVLGPASDGGYWCVGVRTPVGGLFDGVAWSSSGTLAATLARARKLGLQVALADPWTDVDHPEDLDVLAEQVQKLRARGDRETARHAERWLRSEGVLAHDAGSAEADH